MKEDREVRLCSVNNSLDAQCIVDLMKENGIASYKKSGIMEVYGGSSIENDIYVSETNYDRAMQIVKEYHSFFWEYNNPYDKVPAPVIIFDKTKK